MAEQSERRGISGGGLLKALPRVALATALGLAIYVGLVEAGLVRSALAPRADGDVALAQSDRPGLRVLFVGNSFTYFNSMPALVHQLAAADKGAPPIFAVEYTAPRWTLKRASGNEGLAELLRGVRWDVVVLQEVSWLPAGSDDLRRREMYPFARALQREITLAGARRTMFFLTWAYKSGEFHGDTFSSMQLRLHWGYWAIASELGAEISPVGLAWAEALRREPGLDLWKRDGRHPSRLGSYLAACVFYGALSGRDPRGNRFVGGVNETEALFLQGVAADVLNDNGYLTAISQASAQLPEPARA